MVPLMSLSLALSRLANGTFCQPKYEEPPKGRCEWLPYSTAIENAPCRGTAHVREDLKTLPRYELMKIA